MSLKLVFEREDLQRVRLAADPDPMWEVVLGLQAVREHNAPTRFFPWRHEVNRHLATSQAYRASVGMMIQLVHPTGDFPDFLTPPGHITSLDEGCEALMGTPTRQLSGDLTPMFAADTAPTWVRLLATGDRRQVIELVRAVRHTFDLMVGPRWDIIQTTTTADYLRRVHDLTTSGLGAMLSAIPGVLAWDGRVLHTRYPLDRTVRLAGRGLTLVPSYFNWANPITWIDPELPPILVYAADDTANTNRVDNALLTPRSLAALLGNTRAECLRLLLQSHTTSGLAQHLGTSIGTASKQATVLREAGLITTSRSGGAVQHTLTPLGRALLAGHLPIPL